MTGLVVLCNISHPCIYLIQYGCENRTDKTTKRGSNGNANLFKLRHFILHSSFLYIFCANRKRGTIVRNVDPPTLPNNAHRFAKLKGGTQAPTYTPSPKCISQAYLSQTIFRVSILNMRIGMKAFLLNDMGCILLHQENY